MKYWPYKLGFFYLLKIMAEFLLEYEIGFSCSI